MNTDRKATLEDLEKSFLDHYAVVAEKSNFFDSAFYEKFNVKRGLRNNDGSGVVVGLTEIGEVHGYTVEEFEKKPCEGRLRYRGYDVVDLVKGVQERGGLSGFEETIFLLLFNALPTQTELENFTKLLGNLRSLPPGFKEDVILRFPSPDIMNQLARSVLFNYSFDENPEDNSVKNVLRQSVELIARFPVMVAYAYQAKRHYHDEGSLVIHTPDPKLNTAENLLLMIRGPKNYSKLEAELLDLALVLHAEHGGGNNSTFAMRLITSAMTDTYSAIAGAIGSLKGIRHGGANIKVRYMIDNIKSNVPDYSDEKLLRDYMVKIVKKEVFDKRGLLYGIGHAVYTLSDPRAILLRERAEILAKDKGYEKEFQLYTNIEKLAPEVLHEVKGPGIKDLCANVDLYSGFVYEMLDIPQELFTPIFAISRVAGWCAHRLEEIVSGGKIIRPAYKSVIKPPVYTSIEKRVSGETQKKG